MSKLNITDSQVKILDKIYDRGHDVLYHGVESPSHADYIAANSAYKNVIDSPPSGVNPSVIENTTKSGTRTAAAAIVAYVTPTIHIIRSTTTSIVSLFNPAVLMSEPKTFNSKQRKVLFMFNGYATASVTSKLAISPYISPTPIGEPYIFTVSTTGTYIYGSWEITMVDSETAVVGMFASTLDPTANITLSHTSNQVVTIYG